MTYIYINWGIIALCTGYLAFATVLYLAGVYLRWRDRQALAREETHS